MNLQFSRMLLATLLMLSCAGARSVEPSLAPYRIEGREIKTPLDNLRGDAQRGRAIVQDRNLSACVLCHALPAAELRPDQPFAGNLAPSLAGIGTRMNAGELRLRLVDSTRLNAATIMPAYHRSEGLNRVASAYQGRPILNAQQIEDMVAYLQTLK